MYDDNASAPQPLLTISAFARTVGLTPSALRFYDDCGLLRPVRVDDRTGYRYYTAAQERRAVLVRRLRDIDLPLPQVGEVLDADADTAERLLTAHVATVSGRAEQARTVAADVVAALRREQQPDLAAPTRARLGGAELASAVRQVSPAVASSDEVPALAGVLAEIDGGAIAFVATDRYWMAVRTLPLDDWEGPGRRLLVSAVQLREVAAWAARHPWVELSVDGRTAELSAQGETRRLELADDTFPSYRSILEDQTDRPTRVVLDRADLLRCVLAHDETLRLTVGHDTLDIAGAEDRHGVRLPALTTGPALTIGFAPPLLAAALATSVGPDVLLDLGAPDRAVVVRSADQGSFTTLVMPTVLMAPGGGEHSPVPGHR